MAGSKVSRSGNSLEGELAEPHKVSYVVIVRETPQLIKPQGVHKMVQSDHRLQIVPAASNVKSYNYLSESPLTSISITLAKLKAITRKGTHVQIDPKTRTSEALSYLSRQSKMAW